MILRLKNNYPINMDLVGKKLTIKVLEYDSNEYSIFRTPNVLQTPMSDTYTIISYDNNNYYLTTEKTKGRTMQFVIFKDDNQWYYQSIDSSYHISYHTWSKYRIEVTFL